MFAVGFLLALETANGRSLNPSSFRELARCLNWVGADGQLADGYRVARRAFYMGRWIRGAGWYPDFQLRLYNRTRGHWGERRIHESVLMDEEARVETLKGDILHYPGRDAAYHHRMIGERYAPLAAQQMFDQGSHTSRIGIATAGPAAFVRSFILKGGFRDGVAGLSIANFAAHHAFLKHLMLWEMQKSSGARQKPDHKGGLT